MELLDGKVVRDKIFEELKERINGLDLTLAIIQIGNNEASNIYIRQKEKTCNNLGINFKLYKLEENVLEEEVINLIKELNNSNVTGILLQLPIPKHLNVKKIVDCIDEKKDVDGLTSKNVAKLVLKEKGLIPCTPKGVMSLLKYYNINVEGKKVTIIGRSNLVGKPLANLMLNCNATVTVCHSKTKNLKELTLNADIIIVAVGHPNLITSDMVKVGAIIVDVGINRVDGKIVGDVAFDNVSKIVNYISPVPGGVGPMTIASLIENIYEAYLLQNN